MPQARVDGSDVRHSVGFQPFLKGLRSTADKNAYPVLPRGASTKDAAKMNAGLGGKLESFVEHAIADARGEKQKWFCGCFRSAAKKIESVLAAVHKRSVTSRRTLNVSHGYVQGSSACDGTFVHSRKDALDLFRRAAEAAAKPFLFLSAGVSNRVFNEALELASEAGVHFCGVLCGRATWKDGVGVFVRGGAEALQKWLETDGVANIRAVNASLRHATPWLEKYPANE